MHAYIAKLWHPFKHYRSIKMSRATEISLVSVLTTNAGLLSIDNPVSDILTFNNA